MAQGADALTGAVRARSEPKGPKTSCQRLRLPADRVSSIFIGPLLEVTFAAVPRHSYDERRRENVTEDEDV
jgi:hypothetical protein